MKPILVAAGLALAIGGTAQAQPAFNPAGIAQLRVEALQGNQPARVAFDQGFVLDAGAAVDPARDNLTLTHVPARSAWLLEIPVVLTMEGARDVRVSCDVSSFTLPIPFSSIVPPPPTLLGATEHAFTANGAFLGRIVLGVPAIAANPEQSGMAFAHCELAASGVRNGQVWRTYEYFPLAGAARSAAAGVQYVLEADNSRLWTGPSFNRQMVLTVLGSIVPPP